MKCTKGITGIKGTELEEDRRRKSVKTWKTRRQREYEARFNGRTSGRE